MSNIFREKKSLTLKPLAVSIALIAASASTSTQAAEEGSFIDALTNGKAFANLRLRYEHADFDNALDSADALTLDTSFGYKTKDYYGWSFLVEGEDVREVLGVRDFSVPPAGVRAGEFDVILDPETTELDQAFVQYKANGFLAKLGRQVITHDGHRFIGHVGWRQDRQTFDGVTLGYESDGLALTGSYVTQRNRIFAEEADIDSEDIFLNASYKFGTGKLVAYSYLLEQDDNGPEIDTYGISYNGKFNAGSSTFNYGLEYATQDNGDLDTDYIHINGGAKFGAFKLGLGYELLGSDDGAGAFTTPLATLHKFNGWADVFAGGTPDRGLEDIYASLDIAIAGGKGGNFKLVFHDFDGDETNPVTGSDDYGDEIDVQYTYNFSKHVYSGIKYANYNGGEGGPGLVDRERIWAWVGFKFK